MKALLTPERIANAIVILKSFLLGTYDHRDGDVEDAFEIGIKALELLKHPSKKDRPELEKALDGVIKGRLMSIETLAWHRNYDWSEKDRIVREHLECLKKDLLLLYPDEEEIRKDERDKVIREVERDIIYVALEYDGTPAMHLQTNSHKSAEKWGALKKGEK